MVEEEMVLRLDASPLVIVVSPPPPVSEVGSKGTEVRTSQPYRTYVGVPGEACQQKEWSLIEEESEAVGGEPYHYLGSYND